MRKRVPGTKPTVQTLLIGAISVLSASVFLSLVAAQPETGNSQSLEVSPPSQEIPVDPGSVVEVKAKIRNRTNSKLPFDVRLGDFEASGVEGQIALTEKGPWAVSTWSTLSPTNFVLGPGEVKEVTATVQIPSTGVAGGRYGAFVFTVKGSAEPGKAALNQEIASLFLLDIAGPRDEQLTITSFSIPSFLEFGPVPMSLRYKNSGNVHLKAHGVVAVTDMFGRKVADVVHIGTNVFPGAERQVELKWNERLLFGKYTALAIINSGGTKNKTLTATTTFFVFPVRIAAIVFLSIVFLFMIRKRLAKAAKALAGK
jgi:hypothetical protein